MTDYLMRPDHREAMVRADAFGSPIGDEAPLQGPALSAAIVAWLAEREEATLAQVASAFGISAATATRRLQRPERDGLVVCTPGSRVPSRPRRYRAAPT